MHFQCMFAKLLENKKKKKNAPGVDLKLYCILISTVRHSKSDNSYYLQKNNHTYFKRCRVMQYINCKYIL